MKTYMTIAIVIISFFSIHSCEKKDDEFKDPQINSNKIDKAAKVSTRGEPDPPTWMESVTPEIIPGENPGGNRTCDEVESWAKTTYPDIDLVCGEKIDYVSGSFVTGFPGLDYVTVDDEGILSFGMSNCYEIGGKYYMVGAVIVKGSNSANVYLYPNGTKMDAGLIAPGGHMVSNVTFCFIECIITVKCKIKQEDGTVFWAISSGYNVFPDVDEWCGEWPLGVNGFSPQAVINMLKYGSTDVGDVSIDNGIVTIMIDDDLILINTHLFVGTLVELKNSLSTGGCPAHWASPWLINTDGGNTADFDLNN